jgi:hypothetical protein
MPEPTPTQQRALDAAQAVYRSGGTKREGVAAGLAVIGKSTPAGYLPQIPGGRRPTIPAFHVPVANVEDAERLANYLAEYGNYPAGLSPCFVAGLNGDAAEVCPFYGKDFCTCDPPEGN